MVSPSPTICEMKYVKEPHVLAVSHLINFFKATVYNTGSICIRTTVSDSGASRPVDGGGGFPAGLAVILSNRNALRGIRAH